MRLDTSLLLTGALFLTAGSDAWSAPQGGPLRGPSRYVIAADAAWIDAETRIEPAYLVVADGRIQSIRRRLSPMAQRLEQIEVAGTLAPGIVDAWCDLRPAGLASSSRNPDHGALTDALPADVVGADPVLATQVEAARSAGISACYLNSGARQLRRGTGTAALFGANSLPVPAGEEFLEFALGSATTFGTAALLSAARLERVFEDAVAHREALDEYRDELEKFEQDLEDYRKKLEEHEKKKEESGEGDAKDQQAGGGKGGGDEEKKEEPKLPKRPERPKKPASTPARDLVLRALDRDLPVRVEAHSAFDLLRALELAERYGFRLVLAGGRDADLLATRIAAADVPVVLAVEDPGAPILDPDRSFARRYRALREAGVEVALASGGSAGQAMLLLRAGELVAAGADAAEVWASLTSVPAGILGLAQTHGRLADGGSADFLLFEGTSPFDASAPFRVHRAGRRFDS